MLVLRYLQPGSGTAEMINHAPDTDSDLDGRGVWHVIQRPFSG